METNQTNQSETNVKNVPAPPSISFQSIRSVLWDEINNLRHGVQTAENVTSIANATGKILNSVKLELEFYKLSGARPTTAMIGFSTQSTE